MAGLLLERVTVGYGGPPVLDDLTLEVRAGEVAALIGPNGAGKTTLLRTAWGALPPASGRVLLDGRDVRHMPVREAALRLCGLPQEDDPEFEFTVEEQASMGRHARLGRWRPMGADDRVAVAVALEAVGLTALAHRSVRRLSGGERRRAGLARCLAQDAPVVLLDEPTAHLDLAQARRALATLRDLAHARGRAVLVSLHDPNVASLFADRVVLLAGGRVVADGPPADVLTEARWAEAFGARVRVVPHPETGAPMVLPCDGAP